MKLFIDWIERGLVPDWLVRHIIRRVLSELSNLDDVNNVEVDGDLVQDFIAELREAPLIGRSDLADLVGMELPLDFYKLVLGPSLKFSGCYWPEGVLDLAEAESESIKLYIEKAGVEDGMEILDFGCGWGSLTLALAEKFPNSNVTAVSYSQQHVDYINNLAAQRGFSNINAIRTGIRKFYAQVKFDRIFSIDALVHQSNLEKFFERFASWLNPEGQVFVQLFSHRDKAYLLQYDNEYEWMHRYFINAGIMPSDSLLLYFQRNLLIERHWRKSGIHYARTTESWLANMEKNKEKVLAIMKAKYGTEGLAWFHRWRMFFLTASELFSFRNGNEWIVSYYLFTLR